MVFFVEAREPGGTFYRVGVGCRLAPHLVSMVVALARFF